MSNSSTTKFHILGLLGGGCLGGILASHGIYIHSWLYWAIIIPGCTAWAFASYWFTHTESK